MSSHKLIHSSLLKEAYSTSGNADTRCELRRLLGTQVPGLIEDKWHHWESLEYICELMCGPDEGNVWWFSDENTVYYFVGKTEEDCLPQPKKRKKIERDNRRRES